MAPPPVLEVEMTSLGTTTLSTKIHRSQGGQVGKGCVSTKDDIIIHALNKGWVRGKLTGTVEKK